MRIPFFTAVVPVGLAVVLVAPAAFAQSDAAFPPMATFDASVSVDLVTVEVVAVDDRGRPVLDLGREDFRLFEDGRPVEITHFEQPSLVAKSTSVAAAPGSRGRDETAPPDSPAHVVVFVDNLHIGVVHREALFESLAKVLDASLRPHDEVMVVSYDGGVSIELPFSSSRHELTAALDRQRVTEARYMIAALEQQRTLERIQRAAEVEAGGAKNPGVACLSVGSFAWEAAQDSRGEVLQTIDSMRQFVGTLAGIPGRKTLIHVSDGIPLTPGAALVQYAIDFCDGTAAQEGISHTTDTSVVPNEVNDRWNPAFSRVEIMSLDTSKEWYRLTAQANAHRVTFYPLQTSGVTGFASSIAGEVRTTHHTEMLARQDPRDSLVLMAEETGGRAILNANDFAPALTRAIEDGRHAYVLGFAPAGGQEERRHQLRVEATRASTRLRYPKSYYRESPHRQMADAVVSSLLHGVESNPLELRISLVDTGEGESPNSLRVVVPLDKPALLPVSEQAEGLLTFFVAVRREDGSTSEVRQSTIPLRVASGAAAEGQSFVYDLGMRLPPGTHRVAVGVYDEIGGGLSYLRRDVVVKAGV
jgi:VWFA-related protein